MLQILGLGFAVAAFSDVSHNFHESSLHLVLLPLDADDDTHLSQLMTVPYTTLISGSVFSPFA